MGIFYTTIQIKNHFTCGYDRDSENSFLYFIGSSFFFLFSVNFFFSNLVLQMDLNKLVNFSWKKEQMLNV